MTNYFFYYIIPFRYKILLKGVIMKDLELNHWLMLSDTKKPTKQTGLAFVYMATIFACAYVAVSLLN